MRTRMLALLGLPVFPAVVHAGSPLELGGFTGVTYFGSENDLGDSTQAHGPETSITFGGRLAVIPEQHRAFKLGGELELSYTPSSAVGQLGTKRSSVDTPIFGYRAFVLARIDHDWVKPHLELGFGGASITTSNQLVSRDTDRVWIAGVGADFKMSERLALRIDARQTWMPQRDNTLGAGYEVQVGVTGTIGHTRSRDAILIEPPVHETPVQEADGDHDGILDKDDKCPMDPETKNGVDDNDGCPERDDDGDGLVGSMDKCPDKAEDKDGFQDDDGCPELDNDSDGIADKDDKCPMQPETKNGIDDADGCPDEMPAAYAAAFAAAAQVSFEAGKSRLSDTAKGALDKTGALLMGKPKLEIVITVHPEGPGDPAADLAKKRAEAVKWALMDQGAAAKQLTLKVGAPVTKPPLLDLGLAP